MADRVQILSGSFFEEASSRGDVYALKATLHSDDADAAAILRNCRRAMTSRGGRLVVERVIAAPDLAARRRAG